MLEFLDIERLQGECFFICQNVWQMFLENVSEGPFRAMQHMARVNSAIRRDTYLPRARTAIQIDI